METPAFEALHKDDSLPPLVIGPISRQTLALYAGASGDHNPMHIDSDFAKQSGMDDVFAHGMLSMAYLGRLLTNWVPQTALREFSTRFSAITHVGDQLTCQGIVTETFERANEHCVRLRLTAANQQGEIKLQGEAVIAFA